MPYIPSNSHFDSHSSVSQVVQPASPESSIARAGGAVDSTDSVLIAVVVAVAFYYLYKKLWRDGGRCAICGLAKSGRCSGTESALCKGQRD